MTWEDTGYADAMKDIAKVPGARCYPTRDKHSKNAETRYLKGYRKAMADEKLRREAAR